MDQMDAIFRVMRFIEDHLCEPIDVAAMADEAGYSLYHFCRTFSKVTRHTPHDYLLRRRITEAAQLLLKTSQRIVDIAFEYQFNSHEGFTRAFGRMLGLSPMDAREQGIVPVLRTLPPLTYEHLTCLQTHHYLIPDLLPDSQFDMPISIPNQSPTIHPSVEWRLIPINESENTLTSPASYTFKGLYARFTLEAASNDLALVWDWVLHVWLFYTSYHLHEPYLILQRSDASKTFLYVPIE